MKENLLYIIIAHLFLTKMAKKQCYHSTRVLSWKLHLFIILGNGLSRMYKAIATCT